MLPDGRPELVVHLGDPFERIHEEGSVERQARVIFAGQITSRLILRPTGRVAVLAYAFTQTARRPSSDGRRTISRDEHPRTTSFRARSHAS